MGPPTDPGPLVSARVSKWSVHPCQLRCPMLSRRCRLTKMIKKPDAADLSTPAEHSPQLLMSDNQTIAYV
ncbi:unnamed protein product [Staurois parvus]|uniref:Uncharacterized protein n=1 Tax=Staurois parvus TaxID=386267 RepID=A0ABN9EB59_9NEOB|nr:unnamed protein product [Staurois parvus]